jgi:hypothetical protein
MALVDITRAVGDQPAAIHSTPRHLPILTVATLTVTAALTATRI